MALPTSRNRTYVHNATIIEAVDLNELQDYLIALYTTPVEVFLSGSAAQWYSGGATVANRMGDLTLAGGTPTLIQGVTASLAAEFPLAIPVGWKLHEVKAYVLGNAASALNFRVHRGAIVAGTKTQRGTTKSSTLAATVQTLTCDATSDPAAFPYTVAAGEAMTCEVQLGTTTPTTQQVLGVSYKFSRQ